MGLILLFLFIAIPLAEIAIFIEVGRAIDLWPTIGLVVLTAVVGAALARQQGLSAMARLRRDLDQGVMPGQAIFDGAAVLVAGCLLVTPGFLTDSLGFLLLVPPVRRLLQAYLASRVVILAARRAGQAGPGAGPNRGSGDGSRVRPGGTVIEGDYQEVEPGDEDKPRGP